jgi:hypothetical protein
MSELLSAIDTLAATDLDGTLDAERGAELRELYLSRTRLDAQINRRLGHFDARGLGAADGASSTQSWLRAHARLAPAEAAGEVHTARGLRDFATTAAAWEAGEINRQHARAITMLARETSVEATQRVESALVEVARLCDPLRFANELRAWRESLRRSGDGKDESSVESRRELTLAASIGGMTSIKGWLTPEVGELVRTLLSSLAAPHTGETRTAAQRNHDGLGEACRRLLDGNEVARGHRVRPSLLVLCTMDGLLDAERGEAARLGYGSVVDQRTLQRLACDSTVTRVLLSPEGEVLDLGRSARTVSVAQWKALVVRDGGCVVPGCDRPATWCDAHHLLWWTRGGPTDLDNLALVCGYHHALIHEHAWTLGRDPDGNWALRRPDGTVVQVANNESSNPLRRGRALSAMLDPPVAACCPA